MEAKAKFQDGGPGVGESPAPGPSGHNLKVVPRRHWGRWVGAAILTFIVAALLYSVAMNDRFEWGVVGEYLFSPRIMRGLMITIQLTVIAMLIGIALGVMIAIARQSPNPVMRTVAAVYIWFFRGVPLLVQLLFWSFIAALYPTVSLGVPFGGPVFWQADANSLVTPFAAAILGLSLNEGAYMAEITRGGLLSVPQGQVEAAQSIGMTRLQTLRRVVLPQAMRVIIPPTGNETITMLKYTSLVSVIALSDLLYSAQLIYGENFKTIPLLIVASFWYLVLTSILTIGQGYLERRYNRSSSPVGHRRSLLTIFRKPRQEAEVS